MTLTERWMAAHDTDPLRRELITVLTTPTGRSSAGWPYLERHAWARFRDWVPHHLADGRAVLQAVDTLLSDLDLLDPTDEERTWAEDAARVIRQVVLTAQITAPPDLWLLRHVLSALDRVGVLDRWRADDLVAPDDLPGLAPDLQLLLARGFLVRKGGGYRWSSLRTPRRVLQELAPLSADHPTDLARRWAAVFAGGPSDALLAGLAEELPRQARPRVPPVWLPTPEDIALGWLLVPVVLGLRAAGRIPELLERGEVVLDGPLGASAIAVLRAAGAVDDRGALTETGRRVLERGPGPFGIIEAYHPYMAVLDRILTEGGAAVHVVRGANVAASQDANRRTFQRANDALDAFCEATGFTYTVFVEHAVGRGEAIRQRWSRSGDVLTYVAADLEDAAIDAAIAEQRAGRLPENTVFVRGADIGRPEVLVEAMRARGIPTEGAVMLVGNGFHEIRDQTDARMIEVFRDYARAGFVLLFTEESALATDDLLNTAWNTYHAGFRYVHQRSGQGLRPALPTPPSRLGPSLPTSWAECALAAGYVRMDRFCSRSRTIYPYPPANGVNPAISVNHFFVPERVLAGLPRPP